MRTYETCLLSLSGKVSLFASAPYFNDSAAIDAAQGLCRHGELAQVWRDNVCIHNDGISRLTRWDFESASLPLRS